MFSVLLRAIKEAFQGLRNSNKTAVKYNLESQETYQSPLSQTYFWRSAILEVRLFAH